MSDTVARGILKNKAVGGMFCLSATTVYKQRCAKLITQKQCVLWGM